MTEQSNTRRARLERSGIIRILTVLRRHTDLWGHPFRGGRAPGLVGSMGIPGDQPGGGGLHRLVEFES